MLKKISHVVKIYSAKMFIETIRNKELTEKNVNLIFKGENLFLDIKALVCSVILDILRSLIIADMTVNELTSSSVIILRIMTVMIMMIIIKMLMVIVLIIILITKNINYEDINNTTPITTQY